jgi:hypothetical protein
MNNATFAVTKGRGRVQNPTWHASSREKHYSKKRVQIVISSNAQYWKYIRPIVSIFISRARVSHSLQMEARSPVSCNLVYLYNIVLTSWQYKISVNSHWCQINNWQPETRLHVFKGEVGKKGEGHKYRRGNEGMTKYGRGKCSRRSTCDFERLYFESSRELC